MSNSVLTSLLAQGNNGNEILSILDAIVADYVNPESDENYLPILQQNVNVEELAF
jgi:hypothetical protein